MPCKHLPTVSMKIKKTLQNSIVLDNLDKARLPTISSLPIAKQSFPEKS